MVQAASVHAVVTILQQLRIILVLLVRRLRVSLLLPEANQAAVPGPEGAARGAAAVGLAVNLEAKRPLRLWARPPLRGRRLPRM